MPTSFDPRPEGYLATFDGSLRLDEVEAVHAAAVERYGDGSLRWVVLDMSGAWVEPPMTNGEEAEQLEIVFRMARYVAEANTPSLRLAVVIHDELTAALVRLTGTAAELSPPMIPNATVEFAQFQDVPTATAWAAGG